MFRNALILSLFVTVANIASAQNPYVLDIYGDGVHAFYRGEQARASELFDKAISNGSRDPRVYYFRALTQLNTGNRAAAEQDIRTGVMFELRGQGTYDLGMALARVQGPHRLEFEDLRTDAKLDLSGRPGQSPRPLPPYFEPIDVDEDPLADEMPLTDGPSFGADPFQDDPEEDSSDASDLDLDDSMAEEPADDATDDAAMPDADTDDPLGADEPSDEPVDEMPADEDPFGTDDSDEDPFGDSGDVDENPFADDPDADSPGTGETGAGEQPSADPADDPFADDPFE